MIKAVSYPLRPNVLKMKPYSPGKPIEEVKRELGLDEIVKLASNENPLGPSPMAVLAVCEEATRMHLYPDASGYEVRQKLAERLRVDCDQIVLGNGSDELIHLLGQVFLGDAGDEVVTGHPSFVRYAAAAQLADCKLVEVPLDADLRLDLPAMASAAATEKTKLIFIANPNNPTGTIVRKPALDTFLAAIPKSALVVLDEAYFEFARQDPEYPDGLDYLRSGARVAVLRTFSKTYGLAGARLGYMVANEAVVDAVNRAREPFDVNRLAQAAVLAAMDDFEHIANTIAVNAEGIRRISEAFREIGARPIESFANFVLADLGQPAMPFYEALLHQGVIVRPGNVLGLPNALRVSVGTRQEIDRFIAALYTVAPTLGGVR